MRRLAILSITALLVCPGLGASELIGYKLYLTAAGISVGAGSCTLSETHTLYNNADAREMRLAMATGVGASVFYEMADTMTSVQDLQGNSLFYRKAVNENDKHNLETADFSEDGTRHRVRLLVKSSGKTVYDRNEESDARIYDMLSMMRYARGLDSKGKIPGYTVKLPMVNGEQVVMQDIVFQGRTRVRTAGGNRKDCLKLSVRDRKYGELRETLVIYVTDDNLHIPVRMDLRLYNGQALYIKALIETYNQEEI